MEGYTLEPNAIQRPCVVKVQGWLCRLESTFAEERSGASDLPRQLFILLAMHKELSDPIAQADQDKTRIEL